MAVFPVALRCRNDSLPRPQPHPGRPSARLLRPPVASARLATAAVRCYRDPMATHESAMLMPRTTEGPNRFAPRGPSDPNVDAAKGAWLTAMHSGLSVRAASEATGVHNWVAYRWAREDPEFEEAWQVARESAGHDIEAAMVRRAVERDDMPAVISGFAYLKRLWPHLYVPERQAQVQVNVGVYLDPAQARALLADARRQEQEERRAAARTVDALPPGDTPEP